MIRRISSVATAAVVTLTAAGAWAQDVPGGFGRQGTFAISAERLFGFSNTHLDVETEVPGGTVSETSSVTQFSLLGMQGDNPFDFPRPYSHPRIGFDYFVIDSLSIGGSLIYSTVSTEFETENGGVSQTNDGPTRTTFVFAPRVGYAFMFNDTIGIWPRGGFTYFSASSETESPAGNEEDSLDGLAFSLEALLMITPIPHVGFTVGPSLDLGLTGSQEDQEIGEPAVESDATMRDIGIQAGIAVWF